MAPTPPVKQDSAYGNGPQAPKPFIQAGKIWVERVFPQGTSHDEQALEARVFATQPAEVSAVFSRTINLGNFESVRIEVGARMPCYSEEVENGMSAVAALVGNFVDKEVSDMNKALKKKA